MSLEAETLRRLYQCFFPESATPPEWFDRLAPLLEEYDVDVVDVVSYFRAMFVHENRLSPANPAASQALRAPLRALNLFDSKVTVVVHATRSEACLDKVLDFYNGVGIRPLVVVDDRTSDKAQQLLSRRAAASIDLRGGRRDDSFLPDVFERIDTDWVLRVGDDELPTPALLNFVDKAVAYSSNFEWGFTRIHCRYDTTSESLQYSQFLPYGPFATADRQWRLMAKPAGPRERRAAAPDAVLLSLDWVVHSFAERIDTLRARESQEPTAASLLPFHLHEAIPESWHMFAPLPGGQYAEFARQVSLARAGANSPGLLTRDESGEAV